jgi:hypothetical protein
MRQKRSESISHYREANPGLTLSNPTPHALQGDENILPMPSRYFSFETFVCFFGLG